MLLVELQHFALAVQRQCAVRKNLRQLAHWKIPAQLVLLAVVFEIDVVLMPLVGSESDSTKNLVIRGVESAGVVNAKYFYLAVVDGLGVVGGRG